MLTRQSVRNYSKTCTKPILTWEIKNQVSVLSQVDFDSALVLLFEQNTQENLSWTTQKDRHAKLPDPLPQLPGTYSNLISLTVLLF